MCETLPSSFQSIPHYFAEVYKEIKNRPVMPNTAKLMMFLELYSFILPNFER